MKKNKTSFEIRFCAGFVEGNLFEAFDAVFDFAHLDYYKRNLSEAVLHCYKRKIYEQENPCNVFVFYTAVCSFLKVCYCLKDKSKKWKLKDSFRSETVFHLSSLTKEEYDNPFLVLQKAFQEKTLQEFDFFLSEIVEFSLPSYDGDSDSDLTTPYIPLIKMLDAGELVRERGFERIKKTDHTDPVIE
ncbi:hypothetical protein NJT12_13660 [Flavobacterium sp. AC]|uniref:Uncharacterized protein n=1 Tax=Flavobacterium azizsancarii TaxID=2961580 RepID=A0ABT4WDY5_9FLAO|nr:hypothetical protein [Flavobacterium azizsancarii]MDA6070670.1 hypothetical protein [Flavobacterium azizsancarii]